MKKQIVKIEAQVRWKIHQPDGSNDHWLGVCDELGLTLSAETFPELQSIIAEGVDLLLQDLIADNELEEFLHARGWTLMTPLPSDRKNVKFDLPYDYERLSLHDSKEAFAQ